MPAPSTTGGSGNMGYPSTVDSGAVVPAIISIEASVLPSASGVFTANLVYLYAFEIYYPIIITAGKWRSTATATGKASMAIYTLAGNLIAGSDTGQINNAANTDNTVTYTTPISLAPGIYWMAWASSNATDTYLQRGLSANTTSDRLRTAANNISGGAMPATTGALSIVALSPACSFTVQGGI